MLPFNRKVIIILCSLLCVALCCAVLCCVLAVLRWAWALRLWPDWILEAQLAGRLCARDLRFAVY